LPTKEAFPFLFWHHSEALNAALHGHVEGKRSRGRQRKIWMDNVREDLKEKNIDLTRIGEATRKERSGGVL